MELWIPLTILAAFFQNLRSALQKSLTGSLSTTGATAVRFVYGAPFAALYAFFMIRFTGAEIPDVSSAFMGWVALGGVAQILATAALIQSFSHRSFVIGTTYSKTETVQTAIASVLIIGDPLTITAAVAIGISFIGVVTLGLAKEKMTAANLMGLWRDKAAMLGLACGAGYGIAAVSYRAASLSLELDQVFLSAAFTLMCVLSFQATVTLIYMGLRDRAQIVKVFQNWRGGGLAGLLSVAASFGWFTAMTMQNAAYVRALGQVELIFTFIVSHMFFKEKTTRMEIIGVALVIGGLFVLLV